MACISGRSGVVSFNIATSPRPVREKVRPARSKHSKFDVFEVAGRILSRVEWGRGRAGRILSRLSALPPSPEQFLARHYPGPASAWRPRHHTLRCLGTPTSASVGGFALHEAFLRRVASVSDPRVVQFPPTGDGEAAVCSAGAPKPQTTSVKNTENGLLVARWSVFWAQRCLSWRVARTQTRYCEC